jgi:uncharacterized protein
VPISPQSQRRIAVVGGGVAGLSAAHLLARRHHVTLFESSDSLGGHAHAEPLIGDDGKEFWVDTAFLIFNERTYPNFIRFLEEIGVIGQDISAEMSRCFSDERNALHYSLGQGLKPVLKRPKQYLRMGLVRIIKDLLSFRKRATLDLQNKKDLSGITAEEYLHGYSSEFVESFVLPLTSAIWSLPAKQMREFPISSLLRYFDNHQLLQGRSEKRWRTFLGSSRVYLKSFENSFTGDIRIQTPVHGVKREQDGVDVKTTQGTERFDQVVMATHADISLRLLENPTPTESKLLGAWRYQDSPVTLHQDTRLLHEDRVLWSSWNMIRRQSDHYQISYYLNRLQRLPTKTPVILTLGEPERSIESAQTRRFTYRHPVFDMTSEATQSQLGSLNGADRIYFTGSYFGHGFHEDAVRSSVAVAKAFGTDWNARSVK